MSKFEAFVSHWRLFAPSVIFLIGALVGKNHFPAFLTPEVIFHLGPVIALLSAVWDANRKFGGHLTNKLWMILYGKSAPDYGGDYDTVKSNLMIIHFNQDELCDKIDNEVTAEIERWNVADNQQRKLKIGNVDGLLIIRSNNMEQSSLFKENILTEVYEWSRQNSEKACLVINSDSNLSSDNFKHFKSISDRNLRLINLFLLKRSNERGTLWRKQAALNRVLFLVCFIGLILVYAGFMIFNKLEREEEFANTEAVFRNMLSSYCIHDESQATRFKDILGKYLIQHRDYIESSFGLENINLTIYFSQSDMAINLATTDPAATRGSWKIDNNSITGCGFTNKYHFILYRKSNQGIVYSLSKDDPVEEFKPINCLFSHASPSTPRTILHYAMPSKRDSIIIGLNVYSQTEQDLQNQELLIYLKSMVISLAEMDWFKSPQAEILVLTQK